MKLTEMNTSQLATAICGIAEPLSRIAQDKKLNEALAVYKDNHNENQTVLEKTSGLMFQIVPALLNTHFADMVKVISIMTGKSVEEVQEQNGFQTIMDIKAFFDKDFAVFFSKSADAVQDV